VANRYRSEYTYDANGNIETVERYDADGTGHYDSFAYHYHTIDGCKQQNRLYELIDDAPMSTGSDIVTTATGFDNTSNGVNVNNNYGYDALGHLVRDDREEIELIHWTVAGKVDSIQRPGASSRSPLKFRYGASGLRVSKQVGDFYCTEPGSYREHYIRDAQGNIMATYRYKLLPVPNTTTQAYEASLKLNERPLYGSSRLGSLRTELELRSLPSFDPTSANPVQQVDLNYELTDHLGNVCAVVTGRLLDGNGGGTPKQAELVSAQGYEAFGSLLPGRNYSSGSYRFGFQGQEKDDEMHGSTGTSINYKYRMHDARIGRFLSIDPLAAKYPHNSPYAFSENRVIDGVELEGLEVVSVHADARGFLGFVTGAVAGGVMFDREGFAGYVTPGIGVGLGAGGSLGAGISVSGADWIENAAGPGWSIGGNLHVGVGLEVSVDGNIGQYTYGGATVAVGGGAEAGIFGELNWTFTTKKTTYMDIARMAMGSNATQAALTTKAREVFSSFKTNALSQINTAISTRQTEMSTLCGELNCLQNNGGDSDAIRRTNDRMGTLQKEIGALGQQRDVISSMEYEER
jgi:RHS repeat-associated protein